MKRFGYILEITDSDGDRVESKTFTPSQEKQALAYMVAAKKKYEQLDTDENTFAEYKINLLTYSKY